MRKLIQFFYVFLVAMIMAGVFFIGCVGSDTSSGGSNNNNCIANGKACNGDDQTCCSKWCYWGGATSGYYCHS